MSTPTAPAATLRPVRWTVPCPYDGCGGFVLTDGGHTSWKRGDFPSSGEVVAQCDKAGHAALVKRP